MILMAITLFIATTFRLLLPYSLERVIPALIQRNSDYTAELREVRIGLVSGKFEFLGLKLLREGNVEVSLNRLKVKARWLRFLQGRLVFDDISASGFESSVVLGEKGPTAVAGYELGAIPGSEEAPDEDVTDKLPLKIMSLRLRDFRINLNLPDQNNQLMIQDFHLRNLDLSRPQNPTELAIVARLEGQEFKAEGTVFPLSL
ncbi:unnamed protein product, partial [marine sediment metagenome]